MPYRLTPFQDNYFYHVFNRGVEKRLVFSTDKDYQRFLETIFYYQYQGPKPRLSTYKRFHQRDFYKNPKIVEIICYCLMPNHFHLLLKQISEGGIQEFMRKILNSYTKYYNTRYKRVGSLFQGQFKAVVIESDEQLIHVSRYIHLNPYVADLTSNLESYNYSSYANFIGIKESSICVPQTILGFFKNGDEYKIFINDHESYARELERIKHLLIDID